jgi:aminoglycoside 3-N-acetyltransferase
MKISLQQIKSEVASLGVKEGDTIFISADLLKIGYFSINKEVTFKNLLGILIEIVGSDGTLVIPAYTNSFNFFSKKTDVVFSKNTPTTSGSLSQAFQMCPLVVRSTHPTNSCFAIGKYATYILDGHDENSSSYLPYQRVVSLKGKNLMLGTLEDPKLAPMAMHCAQEVLGLTKKHWLAKIPQSYYYDAHGRLKLFTRNDVGGCTGGGYKLLGAHVINKAISFGKVGRSLSALIDCEKSLAIFKKALIENPESIKCDEKKTCACCYGSPIYRHPVFWIRRIFLFILKKIMNTRYINNFLRTP